MKKIFLSLTTVAVVAVCLSSCKKATCIECSGGGTYEGKFCEEDWNSANMGGMSWKQWSDIVASSPNCKKVK